LQWQIINDVNAAPLSLYYGAQDSASALDQADVTDEELWREIISETLRRIEKVDFSIATPFGDGLRGGKSRESR